MSLRNRLGALIRAAPLLLAGCSPALATLQSDLESASGSDGIARAVRALILTKGERGRRVVEEFDAHRPDFAFDPQRSIAVWFDAPTAGLRFEQIVRPQMEIDTGDLDLDRALAVAAPYSWSTWFLKVPAEDVQEVVRTDAPRGPLFVVRLAQGSPYPGLRCNTERNGLVSWCFVEVDPATLPEPGAAPPEDR